MLREFVRFHEMTFLAFTYLENICENSSTRDLDSIIKYKHSEGSFK